MHGKTQHWSLRATQWLKMSHVKLRRETKYINTNEENARGSSELQPQPVVQLSADFYYQGFTQCWSFCETHTRLFSSRLCVSQCWLLSSRWNSVLKPLWNSDMTFIITVKVSAEAFVQLSADFYHQGATQCWSLCKTQTRLLSSRWN